MKPHALLDEYPEINEKAKELLVDRLDQIGRQIASQDAVYKELSKQTVQTGKELSSELIQSNEKAKKLMDMYEAAVINQNEYLLEEIYKQAFRDGIQFYKALMADTELQL